VVRWNGKTSSTNVTWREVKTRRVSMSKHLYPL
jgi:hypothetical protein